MSILVASALKGEVFLDNTNADALRERAHFDIEQINSSLGQSVKIEDLIDNAVLDDMHTVLFYMISLLEAPYFDMAVERVSSVLGFDIGPVFQASDL